MKSWEHKQELQAADFSRSNTWTASQVIHGPNSTRKFSSVFTRDYHEPDKSNPHSYTATILLIKTLISSHLRLPLHQVLRLKLCMHFLPLMHAIWCAHLSVIDMIFIRGSILGNRNKLWRSPPSRFSPATCDVLSSLNILLYNSALNHSQCSYENTAYLFLIQIP